MEQPQYILNNGTKIVTAKEGISYHMPGLFARHEHLRHRGPGKKGEIAGVVGGTGGDVYWVRHDEGVALYGFTEFDLDEADATT